MPALTTPAPASLGDEEEAMPPIMLNLTALGIAAIYYLWRDGYHLRLIRKRVLHERIAYMLWTSANHAA